MINLLGDFKKSCVRVLNHRADSGEAACYVGFISVLLALGVTLRLLFNLKLLVEYLIYLMGYLLPLGHIE